MGAGSMAARIGSISSPYILYLQESVPWLPSTIFGALSVFAGLAALMFPETKNKTMPQTIEEAENFYRKAFSK